MGSVALELRESTSRSPQHLDQHDAACMAPGGRGAPYGRNQDNELDLQLHVVLREDKKIALNIR